MINDRADVYRNELAKIKADQYPFLTNENGYYIVCGVLHSIERDISQDEWRLELVLAHSKVQNLTKQLEELIPGMVGGTISKSFGNNPEYDEDHPEEGILFQIKKLKDDILILERFGLFLNSNARELESLRTTGCTIQGILAVDDKEVVKANQLELDTINWLIVELVNLRAISKSTTSDRWDNLQNEIRIKSNMLRIVLDSRQFERYGNGLKDSFYKAGEEQSCQLGE